MIFYIFIKFIIVYTLLMNETFQVFDWRAFDEIQSDDQERYVIFAFGRNIDGKTVTMKVCDYKPFFYIKVLDSWNYSHLKRVKEHIIYTLGETYSQSFVNITYEHKKYVYMFNNDRIYKYLKLEFTSHRVMKKTVWLLKKEISIKYKKINLSDKDKGFGLCESNIEPYLRFIHMRNIKPSNWITVKTPKYSKFARTDINIIAKTENVISSTSNKFVKYKVLSWDIECMSSTGEFPDPNNPKDRIIQIGNTIHEYGDEDVTYNHIITLGKCDPIESAIIQSYDTEKEVILAWIKLINKIQPDILTGYNILGFDWKFMFKRAKLLGISNRLLKIGRLKKHKAIIEDGTKEKMGKGDGKEVKGGIKTWYLDIYGIVQIDLYLFFKQEVAYNYLISKKLDYVAEKLIGHNKVNLKPQELFAKFKEGGSANIRDIAVYCIQDCALCNKLIIKKKIDINAIGMSNVCLVPMYYLFFRGQGVKIFSLVSDICRKEDYIFPVITPDDVDPNKYEGAIVLKPKRGIYNFPVLCLDYSSLYPSCGIAENICYTSIVYYYCVDLEGNITFEKGDKSYLDIEGFTYNKIEYDIYEPLDDDERKAIHKRNVKNKDNDEYDQEDENKKKIGKKICVIAINNNGNKSLLPRIYQKLLGARKDVRRKIGFKTINNISGTVTDKNDYYEILDEFKEIHIINKKDVIGEIVDTYDDSMKAMFDGLQLAYKITANSLYGQLGATTSPICMKELAACTTAVGRSMIKLASEKVPLLFKGVNIIYGDSVVGDTPLTMQQKDGTIIIKQIDELCNKWEKYNEFKPFETNRTNKQQGITNLKIWTDMGWSKIRRVIKHKTKKKIYRIITHVGCVDVTEDHSLLNEDGVIIKPNQCKIGTKLLYNKLVWNIAFSKVKKERYIYSSKIEAHKKYIECMIKSKYNWYINYKEDKYILYNSKYNDNENMITHIIDLGYNDGYVYDLETERGRFQAGIGSIIVKNTDSVFVGIEQLLKKDMNPVEFGNKIGFEMEKAMQPYLKSPHKLEFEKQYYPFCIFSKKRYIGNKYMAGENEGKQHYMGIELKRKDNAPIVKEIMSNTMKIILDEKNIEKSKEYYKSMVNKLLNGYFEPDQLIISAELNAKYKNPTHCAHKVLADRIAKRSPGEAPQVKDRIFFCKLDSSKMQCNEIGCNKYIKESESKCLKCLELYCIDHIKKHNKCITICRFCHSTKNITECGICLGWYCTHDMKEHRIMRDEFGDIREKKRCIKPLTKKALRGDLIETPEYIKENNLKIDYKYYLDNQILKPMNRVFSLIMDNPTQLVSEHLINYNNKKNGMRSITSYFTVNINNPAPKISFIKMKSEKLKKKKKQITNTKETCKKTIINLKKTKN